MVHISRKNDSAFLFEVVFRLNFFSIIFIFRLKKKRENENKKVKKNEQNETTNDTANNPTSTEKPNESETIV